MGPGVATGSAGRVVVEGAVAASVLFAGLPCSSPDSWICTTFALLFFVKPEVEVTGFVSQQIEESGVSKEISSSSTSGRLGAGIVGVPDPETSASLFFGTLGTSTRNGSGSSLGILRPFESKAG